MNPIIDTDVLVVGCGGAGFRAAISAAEKGIRIFASYDFSHTAIAIVVLGNSLKNLK